MGDCKSYLFFSSKSSNWHFLVWHKPLLCQRSTAWEKNPKGISNSWIRLIVACLTTAAGWLLRCSLHLIAFQLVPCTLFHSIARTFLATKSFAAGPSTDPCHMEWFLKSVPRNVILQSAVVPNWLEAQWVWCAWVGADHSTSLFLRSSCSSGFLRLLLLMRSQSIVCL